MRYMIGERFTICDIVLLVLYLFYSILERYCFSLNLNFIERFSVLCTNDSHGTFELCYSLRLSL